MRQHLTPYLLAAIAISFTACDTDDDPIDPTYTVPDTYSFERDGASTVTYSGQTERLDQLTLMGTYMKSANTIGAAALDAQTLRNMFANRNSPYSGLTFSKDLQSKCFAPDTVFFQEMMDQLADISQFTSQQAAQGTPGVLTTGNSSSTAGYLVNANGLEPTQVIEKGLMGAVFLYQAMEVYLSNDRMGATGNDEFDGANNYTLMEHYFDEAFGYLGAPIDFPSDLTSDDARFWAKYAYARHTGTDYSGIATDLMLGFRKGRAAITAKEYADRDDAIQSIVTEWETVAGGTIVDYLQKSLSSTSVPLYKRNHQLSEAIGFMIGLKYHSNGGNGKYQPIYVYSKIEDALDIIGTTTDLYALTDTDINNAIAMIRAAYPAGTIK